MKQETPSAYLIFYRVAKDTHEQNKVELLSVVNGAKPVGFKITHMALGTQSQTIAAFLDKGDAEKAFTALSKTLKPIVKGEQLALSEYPQKEIGLLLPTRTIEPA